MLITLYKIGGVHFRLLATNGFRVKAKKERFTAASSRCRQNLKYENFPSSFGRLRQNIAPKRVLHVQHDYFSPFNQSNHWFVALSLTLPSSDLKLPNDKWSTRGSFSKVLAYLGCHNFLYVFATTRFSAIKLRNPVGFSYIKNMLKDQVFETRRLQSDNGLFVPKNFSGVSRNGPFTT